MNPKILKQEIIKSDTVWKGKIFLSNKKTIRFEMDKKHGWEQWGASHEYLGITMPVVEKYWNEFISQ